MIIPIMKPCRYMIVINKFDKILVLHLIKSKKYSEAIEKSKIILMSESNEKLVYNLLKNIIEQQKQFEQVFELCELAIQKYDSNNQLLKLKAIALLNFKRVNEALELYNQLIFNNPQDLDVYILKCIYQLSQFQSAKVLKQLGKYEQIIKMWDKFVQQFCEVVEGYHNLIQALETLKNYNEIISVCTKAIKKFPDQPKFLQKKGQILHKQKSYLLAIEIYDELIEKKKNEVQYYEMKIKSLTKYKQKMLEQIKDSNKEGDQNKLDWINEQIKICYTQALQENDDEGLEIDRIEFLIDINKKQEAIFFLDKMIKKYPKNIEGYILKAKMLYEEKKFEEIITLYDEAISDQPDNILLYEFKTAILQKQEKWVDAIKCINQALQKSPDSRHFYLLKFKSLYDLNLLKAARQCCRMIPNVYYDTDQEMELCDY